MVANGFYPRARLKIEDGAASSVNVYEAAWRLIGICGFDEMNAALKGKTKKSTTAAFYSAVHEVQAAIAAQVLKAGMGRTAHNRQLEGIVEGVHSLLPNGPRVVLNTGNYTYIALVELERWWREQNTFFADGKTEPPQPVQRQFANEQAVLAKLIELGYEPTRLKRALPGRASVPKSEARKALRLTRAAFDKAWQRLRNDGKISDG
jgi:hypothetical protein